MVVFLLGLGVIIIIWVVTKLMSDKTQRANKNHDLISYLVIPPALGDAPDAPEKLYALFNSLLKNKRKVWSTRKFKIVLEVISSSSQGIRFVISSSWEISDALKDLLIAYWPKLEISKIRDGNGLDIPLDCQYWLKNWRYSKGFVNDNIQTESSLSFLIASMGKLKQNEAMALQLIIGSEYKTLSERMINFVLNLIKSSFRFIGIILADILRGQLVTVYKPIKSVKNNQTKILNVAIRSLVAGSDVNRLANLNLSLETALGGYGLVSKGITRPKLTSFIYRYSNSFNQLTTKQIAQLYYFPKPKNQLQEDLRLSHSSQLAIPLDIKNKHKPAIIVGESIQDERHILISMNASERQKHLLVVGGTGMGKSSLLGYSILQDILNNKGLALIDPHGDLAEEIIGYLPNRRLDKVVYINPTDINYPVGLNLMELPIGLNSEQLEIAKDLITESIVSIFRKIFSDDDSGGHRIEYVLRNAIHTAFNVPDATIFTIHKLLTNDIFRSSIVSQLTDGSLKDFWYGEFNKAGSYQRVKMINGVTSKLGRFQRSVITRRIMEQTKTTIDFSDIMDNQKILIANFAKGSLGEDTSSLLSMIVLAKLQLSAWQRSLIDKNKRKPFYLYVDEFQNFSSPMFSQLVSEARKFGINLIMAEQTTAYQNETEVNILLANVGNVICFRTASELDIKRIGSVFDPYLKDYDLKNLKPYNFYMRISSDLGLQLVSGQTILIRGKKSKTTKNKLVNISRKNYSIVYGTDNLIKDLEKINKIPIKNR